MQCCGYGSRIRCFFDPWIWDKFFPGPGSQTHISKSLVKIFGFNILKNLCQLAQICLYLFKNKIIYNFIDAKNVAQKNFPLLFFVLVGSVRDGRKSGSGIKENEDPGWRKIRIRDKHPGSATLHVCAIYLTTSP